ncbi:hypothetical protein [Mitsuokella multacida]|uniref:hypothetical protein n=1 Tax=Mitsuokella multacida TaxID=52226 RepID=UPI002671C23C|nr:hypothetical protein [Mitsuokella multacida]
MQGKNCPLLARFVHLMQRERQATHGLPWMNWSAYPAFSLCRYMHASWKYRKQDATIMLRKKDQLGQLQERSLASDSNPHQGYRTLMRREVHTSRSKILESLFMEFHHAQTGRAVDTANISDLIGNLIRHDVKDVCDEGKRTRVNLFFAGNGGIEGFAFGIWEFRDSEEAFYRETVIPHSGVQFLRVNLIHKIRSFVLLFVFTAIIRNRNDFIKKIWEKVFSAEAERQAEHQGSQDHACNLAAVHFLPPFW